jgi:hypothetical protein
MDNKETNAPALGASVMLYNTEYYKYIFKKTEKIACAVFYILRSDYTKDNIDQVVSDLENAARDLLDTALVSLSATTGTVDVRAHELRADLVALESHLRLAHAARHIDADILEVFLREIYSLQRSLRSYTDRGVKNPLLTHDQDDREMRERRPARAQVSMAPKITVPGSDTKTRRDRILDVLKEKGPVTIKDITDVVTDCSEKTVQRELIALIKDNRVHREGERRWSKYSLA